jgi:hypothetical protein
VAFYYCNSILQEPAGKQAIYLFHAFKKWAAEEIFSAKKSGK